MSDPNNPNNQNKTDPKAGGPNDGPTAGHGLEGPQGQLPATSQKPAPTAAQRTLSAKEGEELITVTVTNNSRSPRSFTDADGNVKTAQPNGGKVEDVRVPRSLARALNDGDLSVSGDGVEPAEARVSGRPHTRPGQRRVASEEASKQYQHERSGSAQIAAGFENSGDTMTDAERAARDAEGARVDMRGEVAQEVQRKIDSGEGVSEVELEKARRAGTGPSVERPTTGATPPRTGSPQLKPRSRG